MHDIDYKKEYEISFLVKDQGGTQAVLAALKQAEAEIISEGTPRRITLAYPINHETQADFCFVQVSLDPARIGSLDTALRALPQVIRFLIITPPFGRSVTRTMTTQSTRPRITSKPLEQKPSFTEPLTNEALEKKIEEILK